MLVNDLLDLVTSGGAGTAGTDLFGGLYPDSPDSLIGILETGGLPNVHTMSTGPGRAALERPRVQVMVRSTSYQAGRVRSQQVLNLLDGLRDRTINGAAYHWAASVSPPAYLGQDENNRHLFSTNYDIVRERSGTS